MGGTSLQVLRRLGTGPRDPFTTVLLTRALLVATAATRGAGRGQGKDRVPGERRPSPGA
ncbi:hypothetical protein ABT288_41260 [Streptomyces sp. NPDC001093]|uniref:hypothetical protein n=1 Tax=Streptomyces sp. NPDC001093 TaxID=3154376 RepID=UPI00332DD062